MITIDMEMPTSCSECFALNDNGDYPYCLISHESRGYNFDTLTRRMGSCPLKDSKAQTQSKTMIMPQYITELYSHFQCPTCKSYITYKQAYCSQCGTKFTWYDPVYTSVSSAMDQHMEAYG